MNELWKYVTGHALRGPCQCGQCIDAVENPEQPQPTGHTADLIFFEVIINPKNPPNKEDFIKIIKDHPGEFCEIDLFDGNEYSYIRIGAWAGDQGLALMIMGLGTLLGCWKLMTPRNMLPPGLVDEKMVMNMAGSGMISIIAPKEKNDKN